jgi:integrase
MERENRRRAVLPGSDETGAPMKVQQEFMRHANILTTMNVYGEAMDESKRAAHGKVVRLVLPSKVS